MNIKILTIKKIKGDIKMKKNLINKLFLLSLIGLLSIVESYGQTSNLSVICPSGTISAPTVPLVQISVNTTNYSGTANLYIEVDPSKICFINLNGGVSGVSLGAPIILPNGNKEYPISIQVTGASFNQGFGIQVSMCCPLTCYGNSISNNLKVTLKCTSLADVIQNCNILYTTNNTWGGTNTTNASFMQPNWYNQNIYNYNCFTNVVSMFLSISPANCHKINNAKIQLIPNISGATLIDVKEYSNSPIPFSATNNTFDLGTLNTARHFKYTYKLPCNFVNPSIFKVDAKLQGENCGTFNNNIFTFPQAAFTIPTLANSQSSVIVYNQTNQISLGGGIIESRGKITNPGSYILNGSFTSKFLNKKITSIQINCSQPGLQYQLDVIDCNSTIIHTNNGIVSLNYSPTTSALEANTTFTGLNPNEYFEYIIKYDNTLPGCSNSPLPNSNINFQYNVNQTAPVDLNVCNCQTTDGNGGWTTQYYPPQPIIPIVYCYQSGSIAGITACPKAGDILTFCKKYINITNSSLNNPVVSVPLSNDFTLNSITVNGVNIAFTNYGTYVKFNLPNLTTVSPNAVVCFNFTLNANLAEGNHYFFTNDTLTGYYDGSTLYKKQFGYNCYSVVTICGEGSPTLKKEVWDYASNSWQQSGSGLAGVPTKYRFTIDNSTGNRAITNIKLIDRLPHIGDKTLDQCTPRNSQYNITVSSSSSINPSTITMKFINSAIGGITLPNIYSGTMINGICNTSAPLANYNSTPDNTILVEYPGSVPAFGSASFEVTVQIPSNARPGEKACNTTFYYSDFLLASGSVTTCGPNESTPPVCYTILPPPCNTCKDIFKSGNVTLSPSSSNTNYQTMSGSATITISKPVQQITLTLANIKYNWSSDKCTGCKTKAFTRGCLQPTSINQTIGLGGALGQLNYDNWTSATAIDMDKCNSILTYKMGTMLQPGTYTIPFTLSLPKEDLECCKLNLESFNLHLAITDNECNVCDTNIVSTKLNCCSNSSWGSVFYSGLPTTDPFGNTIYPVPTSINTNTPLNINLIEGQSRIFTANYNCNSSISGCMSKVLIKITNPNGSITLANNSLQYNFTSSGTYNVVLQAYCGEKPCREIKFNVVVSKNCCTGNNDWVSAKFNRVLGNSPWLFVEYPAVNLSTFNNSFPFQTTNANSLIFNLNFRCTPGCNATYKIREVLNGVATESIKGSNFQINASNLGTKIIYISALCNGQPCGKTWALKLVCSSNCGNSNTTTSINGPTYQISDGIYNTKKELLSITELKSRLNNAISVGFSITNANIIKIDTSYVLMVTAINAKNGLTEEITITLLKNEYGYLSMQPLVLTSTLGTEESRIFILSDYNENTSSSKTNYVGHVTLLK